MKVFHIGAYPPKKGGLSKYVKGLVGNILFLSGDILIYVFTVSVPGSHKVSIDSSNRVRIFRVISDESLLYGLVITGYMIWERPHIIHIHYSGAGFPHPYNFLPIEIFAKLLRIRVILTMYTILVPPPFIERILVPLADRIIVLSQSHKKELVSIRHIPQKRIIVHPLWDDVLSRINKKKAMEALGIQADRLLLCFGFIMVGKGFEYAIQSMKPVLEMIPNTHLVIAGELHGRASGTYLDRLLHIRKELGLEKNVTITTDYIPENELIYYFSAADALILPYLPQRSVEGASGVFFLAAAYGLPVIVTDIEPLAEPVRESRGGIIVPPGDEKALAKAICSFLSDPELEIELSKNLRAYIRAYCLPSKIAKSTLELYDEMAR